jgi:hypothetical protein
VAPYGTVWHRETLCLDWGSISAGRAVGYGHSFEKSLGSVFRRWIVSSLSYVEVVTWAGFQAFCDAQQRGQETVSVSDQDGRPLL